MPTYEYKCCKCGFQFEAFQSILADPIEDCPKCKDGKVERLISAGAGVIFKGSGFYETDYKKKTTANGSSRPHAAKVDTSASELAAAVKDVTPAKKD